MSKICTNPECKKEIPTAATYCPFCGKQQIPDEELSEEERLRKRIAELEKKIKESENGKDDTTQKVVTELQKQSALLQKQIEDIRNEKSEKTRIDPPTNKTNPPKDHKSKKTLKIVIPITIAIGILIAIIVGIAIKHDNTTDTTDTTETYEALDTFPNEMRIKDVLREYCRANANNDFTSLENLYAPYVVRFQAAHNESRDQVINRHRRYDKVFKVYGKYSSIRWDTFQYYENSNGEIEAIIVEDYSIDREDKSKVSVFVLEKHFTLNKDYQIVSVWDNQLSKS